MDYKIRLIVAGSRSFCNYILLSRKLDFYLQNYKPEEILILSGGAKGADQLGEKYAKKRKIKVEKFIPNWREGNHAGMKRNAEMVSAASHAIFFWDGKSKGTEMSIKTAKKKGLRVVVIEF